MAKYEWRSEHTEILRRLRASLTVKKKLGWSRNIGAGFVAEDLCGVQYLGSTKVIRIFMGEEMIGPNTLIYDIHSIADLNLRETEELIKWLEEKI
jgi:hypothetical protein